MTFINEVETTVVYDNIVVFDDVKELVSKKLSEKLNIVQPTISTNTIYLVQPNNNYETLAITDDFSVHVISDNNDDNDCYERIRFVFDSLKEILKTFCNHECRIKRIQVVYKFVTKTDYTYDRIKKDMLNKIIKSRFMEKFYNIEDFSFNFDIDNNSGIKQTITFGPVNEKQYTRYFANKKFDGEFNGIYTKVISFIENIDGDIGYFEKIKKAIKNSSSECNKTVILLMGEE